MSWVFVDYEPALGGSVDHVKNNKNYWNEEMGWRAHKEEAQRWDTPELALQYMQSRNRSSERKEVLDWLIRVMVQLEFV